MKTKFKDIICFLIMTLLIFLMGYIFRIYHEAGLKESYFHQGRQANLRDIKNNINDRYIFFMEIKDTKEYIKFIPRQDKAVNVTVAGVGDQGVRKTWEGK